jgi:hypothetical protein
MSKNVGGIDRVLRIIVGLGLLWYALFAAPTGYNWIGWIGLVPLATAFMSFCPLYTLLGMNTCPTKRA